MEEMTSSSLSSEVIVDFQEMIDRIKEGAEYSKEHALRSLNMFTNKREFKKQILEIQNILVILINILEDNDNNENNENNENNNNYNNSSNSNVMKELSISTLANLATVVEYKSVFLEVGIINPLINLLKSGTMKCKIDAARLVDQLAIKGPNRQPLCDSGIIPLLLNLANLNNIDGKTEAIKALGIMARSPSICRVIYEEGALSILTELLSNCESDDLKMQSARAIGNLVKSVPEMITDITQGNVISLLINLLRTGSNEGKEQASRTLEILTSDETCVNIMIQEDILPVILLYVQNSESKDDYSLLGVKDHCLRTISGIARFSGGSKIVQTALKNYEISQEITLHIQGQQFRFK